LRFHVEGVFSENISSEETGFSGFNTDGSINLDDLTIKNLHGLLVIMYGIGKGGSFKHAIK